MDRRCRLQAIDLLWSSVVLEGSFAMARHVKIEDQLHFTSRIDMYRSKFVTMIFESIERADISTKYYDPKSARKR